MRAIPNSKKKAPQISTILFDRWERPYGVGVYLLALKGLRFVVKVFTTFHSFPPWIEKFDDDRLISSNQRTGRTLQLHNCTILARPRHQMIQFQWDWDIYRTRKPKSTIRKHTVRQDCLRLQYSYHKNCNQPPHHTDWQESLQSYLPIKSRVH